MKRLILLMSLLALLLGGCSRHDDAAAGDPGKSGAHAEIRTAADLKGRHVAHLSSGFHKQNLLRLEPDITFDAYSEYAIAFESLRKRKIDAISLGQTYADIWLAKYPGEFRVAFGYADDGCSFLFPKGSDLRAAFDAEIRRMTASGEAERIVRKWCDAAKAGDVPNLPEFAPPSPNAREIRVAAAALSEPWSFVSGSREVVGIDVEFLRIIAHRLSLRLKIRNYGWNGMLDAINGGKADVACGGIYTGGNTFSTVDASVAYAPVRMCLLVRDEGAAARRKGGLRRFLASLRESVNRTFVEEGRWRMMLSGLGVTLFITFLSALLGTILAFPLWLVRTSTCRRVAAAAKAYIAILQGTPVLVLLMVLYYIVFGSVDIDGVWVAVIGFSLSASAYLGETLRSGIDSVPRGQAEAALALGYSPRRAFFRFVLPQAVRTILPVYRGEIVSLLKATSIVGYIAINDLTKASDLVRSRTYESFFPILTTAFVYFAASWLLAVALDRLGRRLEPSFRR